MSNYDSHMQVCGAAFIPTSDALVTCDPAAADSAIQVVGTWRELPLTKAEFSEEESENGLMTQKFEGSMTVAENGVLTNLRNLCTNYGLLRIDYTNGERRVVGDDEWPVMLQVTREGDPVKVKLSLKRVTCTRSRLLASL